VDPLLLRVVLWDVRAGGLGPTPPDAGSLPSASRADPVRDIRCEFCGEFFENRKGLSSHARSHLRQMGVTEWSVNGSPIDTLREILKKKSKPCVIKKEPHTSIIETPKGFGEEGMDPKPPGKVLQAMALPPLGGRTGKPGGSSMGRELSLSPLTTKPHGAFLTPLATKRPLQDDRLGPHPEVKHKAYIQTELPFKTKSVHDKPTHTCKCGETRGVACPVSWRLQGGAGWLAMATCWPWSCIGHGHTSAMVWCWPWC